MLTALLRDWTEVKWARLMRREGAREQKELECDSGTTDLGK